MTETPRRAVSEARPASQKAPARYVPREEKGVPGFFPSRRLPYVANVSWPRSGHVLLSRILLETFEGLFGYCEYYRPRRQEDTPCCGAFPCVRRGRVHMTKQHDLTLDAELPRHHRLIVQYRAFLPSVVSHFEQALATGSPVTDTAESFQSFARSQAGLYSRFVDKWVTSPRTNRLVLRYEDFTADPAAAMRDVLALFDAPDYAARMEAVITTIDALRYEDGKTQRLSGVGIADRRDVTAFRFYDPGFFRTLAAKVGEDTP